MAKILVTGGAGFIGSNLVDALVAEGNEVVVLDNLSSGKRENVNSKIKLVVKDIREDLNSLFEKEKFDYVYHLAGQVAVRKSLEDPKGDADINIIGGLNLIDNCAKFEVKKIIFSSTGGALYSSDAQIPCDEDSKISPQSPYGLAKWTIENYLRIIKQIRGLNYVCLRYANVYGPRQDSKGEAGVIAIFLDKIKSGKELVIFGDGKQTRDFVYVQDVVQANLLALNLSGTYNVGTEVKTDVNSIAQKMLKLIGTKTKIIHGEAIKGELRDSCLSSNKLRKEGWKPSYSFDKGLKETVEWFLRAR